MRHDHARSDHDALASLLALPTVPAEEFHHWSPDDDPATNGDQVASPSHESGATRHTLSKGERRLLKAIDRQPGLPSSAYPKLARLGPQQARTLRKSLITAGYLREQRVSTSARGRTSIILELLPPATEALAKERT